MATKAILTIKKLDNDLWQKDGPMEEVIVLSFLFAGLSPVMKIPVRTKQVILLDSELTGLLSD